MDDVGDPSGSSANATAVRTLRGDFYESEEVRRRFKKNPYLDVYGDKVKIAGAFEIVQVSLSFR